MRYAAFLLMFPLLAAAQANPIRGPLIGFVHDPNLSAIRPILGIPGAATLGKPLELGFPVSAAAVSSGQNFAVAVNADSREAVLVDLEDPAFPAFPIRDLPAGVNRLYLSPQGSALAAWYEESRLVVTLAGLPKNPASGARIDLSSAATPPASIAVSDDAALLMAFPDEDALYAATPDGNRFPISYTGKISALRFFHGSHLALATASPGNEVFLIGEDWAPSQIAGQDSGIEDPIAVGLTQDNQWAVVVNGSSAKVAEIELSSKAVRLTECQCSPTSVERMGAAALFRLTELTRAPLWLLETGAPEARLLFVPPDPAEGGN